MDKLTYQPKKGHLLLILVMSMFSLYKGTNLAMSSVNFNATPEEASVHKNLMETMVVQDFMKDQIFNKGILSPTLDYQGENYKIKYTLNTELNDYIQDLLQKFRSDYSSVVVIDNASGKILAASDYKRDKDSFGRNLAFSSTHPSASLFKIISTANFLQTTRVNKDTIFAFNGRSTTLYRGQLVDKFTRWTRFLTLQKAFAMSNNVVFGKAAMENSVATDLYQTAVNFGFNEDLMEDIKLTSSTVPMAESQYNLAEIASGFNDKTMISPVHGALLASIMANEGVLKYPYLIDNITSPAGEIVWRPSGKTKRVIDLKVAQDLSKMMEMTISEGTARKAFRKLKSKLRDGLEVGGKTGSITGGIPYGKRDWFVVYARPKSGGSGISICVMNINVRKWYVRSTFLAKNIIEHYYSDEKSLQNAVVKSTGPALSGTPN